jgi:hypothetical protein
VVYADGDVVGHAPLARDDTGPGGVGPDPEPATPSGSVDGSAVVDGRFSAANRE